MFEMLVGYPPFCSESPTETYRKIMNWRDTLRFPSDAVLSPEAKDLILRLCCSAESRLGSGPDGVNEIKRHPFFAGIDWSNLRGTDGPFKPELSGPTDTRHFEEYDELPEDAQVRVDGELVGGGAATTLADHPSCQSTIDLHAVASSSSSSAAAGDADHDADELVDHGDDVGGENGDAASSSSSSSSNGHRTSPSSAKAAEKRNMKASDIPWIGYTFTSFDAVQARWGMPDDADASFFGEFQQKD
jgi:serine/threonine protein kinase